MTTDEGGSAAPRFELEDAIEILDRRKRWIAIAVAIGLALGAILYLVLPPTYTASTTLLVEPQEIPQNFVRSTVTIGINQRLATLHERVTGYSNLLDLIDRVGADRLDPSGELVREDLMTKIRRNLQVGLGPTRGPAVFNISYSDADPEVAAVVAREVANLFIAENMKERAQQAEATAQFLDRELARVRGEVEDHEKRLQAFREGEMGALPSQLQANLAELDRLNARLENNILTQQSISERMAALRGQAALGPIAAPNAPRGSAAQALEETREQLILAERIYTPEHPNVIRLKAEVERLQREAAEAARRAEQGDDSMLDPASRALRIELAQQKLELDARKREEQTIRARLKEVEGRVEETPKLEADLQSLTRDYDNLKQTYERLLAKKQEAALARNLETAQKGERFKVLRPAQPPRYPSFPDLTLLLPAGMALGLLVVSGMILFAEFRNPSFRSIARLTRTLGLPVVASIPRIDDDRIFEVPPDEAVDPRLVVHTAPESAPAEQYRSFAPVFLEDEKRRVVLVTSAARGDGKSLTCMNLATTIARDLNRRALVIDADLRRPTAHRLLRVKATQGLSDVLQHEATLEETAIETAIPNLSLLPAGHTAKNPLALLTDTVFLEVIEAARHHYDAIFIDSPPLMPVVDTRFLKKLADMVIFVVRADTTPRDAVVRAMQELRDVAGVVFNEVSAGSFRRYYYYDAYSRYAYGAGDGEGEEERG